MEANELGYWTDGLRWENHRSGHENNFHLQITSFVFCVCFIYVLGLPAAEDDRHWTDSNV